MSDIIFSSYVGSILYGINTPDSDIDILEIVYDPIETVLGTYAQKYGRQTIKNGQDKIIYPLKHFLKLLVAGNPNAIQLFQITDSDLILRDTPAWTLIQREYLRLMDIGNINNAYKGIIFNEMSQIQKGKRDEGKHISNIFRYMRDLRLLYSTGYCYYPMSLLDIDTHYNIRQGKTQLPNNLTEEIMEAEIAGFFEFDFRTGSYFDTVEKTMPSQEWANKLCIELYKEYYDIRRII